MQNHFVVNVSLDGQHFFTTAPHSLVSELKAQAVYAELCIRFPAEGGWSVELIEWKAQGTRIAERKGELA